MKEKKWLKRAAITGGVFLAVVALCFALVALYIRAPEIVMSEPGEDVEPAENLLQNGKDPSAPPAGETGAEESAPAGTGAQEPEPVGGDRRAGTYTILLIGTSDNYSADTIMVGTVDTVAKKVHVLGIPRDTKVEAARSVKKINGALGVGGVELLKKETAGILGFKPDFYIKIDLQGLISLVDAIGGVDFDVPYKMNYDDPSQDLHIHFEPGPTHLDGQSAMELVRYRGHAGADLSRMKIQQDFLMAVAKKMITPANITKIGTYAEIYAKNVETDLTVGNLIWFALQGFEIGTENIHMYTLPTYTKDHKVNPSYYQFVSSEEAIKLINETVNPYKKEITGKNVNHVPFVAPVSAATGTDTGAAGEGSATDSAGMTDGSLSGEENSGEEVFREDGDEADAGVVDTGGDDTEDGGVYG